MLLLIRKLKNIKRLNLGFSLVELLVVISIIGVLTAILMANFMGARDKARDAQKIEDLNGMKNALRLYYNDHQSYPAGPQSGVGYTSLANFSAADQAELLKAIPGIAGVGFTYFQRDNGETFQLCVGLDAGSGNDDVNSQVKCGIGATDVCNQGIGNTADKLYVVCAQ